MLPKVLERTEQRCVGWRKQPHIVGIHLVQLVDWAHASDTQAPAAREESSEATAHDLIDAWPTVNLTLGGADSSTVHQAAHALPGG